LMPKTVAVLPEGAADTGEDAALWFKYDVIRAN
jgi:hypothetical protein